MCCPSPPNPSLPIALAALSDSRCLGSDRTKDFIAYRIAYKRVRKRGKANGALITDDTAFVDGDGIEPPTQGFSVRQGER